MSFRFTELCNGCSACARQCPVQAIRGELRVRYHVDEELCTDCGVCGMICPVEGAVLDAEGREVRRVPRDQRPRPVVELDLCNGCGTCLDFCPFDCRQREGRQYHGTSLLAEPLRCVACGECARHCIKGAIRMAPRSLRDYDPAAERLRLRERLAQDESKDD